MSTLIIRGGTLHGPSGAQRRDVVVEGAAVVAVEEDAAVPRSAQVLDASGCYVLPALVDLHAHLRDPGDPEAETIETGARAAALGGYGAVVAMPNTEPAIDCVEAVRYVHDAAEGAVADVLCAGAITLGRAGERLSPMGEMASQGVRIFTDDGAGVQDGLLMRRAMEYGKDLGVVIAEHCEDARLAARGHMHEGRWSSLLGIPGIPVEAETVMAYRDIALASRTGCRLHLLHISASDTVELVRSARSRGVAVSCEVAPHHLALCDSEIASYDPLFKVNPPLRSSDHAAALIGALAGGAIDAVATDHAPHRMHAKELPFDQAPPGMLGLQTALAVVFTVLTSGSGLSAGLDGLSPMGPSEAMALIVETMSARPAEIAGLTEGHGGPVAPGRPAHLCVFDPTTTWAPDLSSLASRSTNCPYLGRKLFGQVRHTIHYGEPVVIDGEARR